MDLAADFVEGLCSAVSRILELLLQPISELCPSESLPGPQLHPASKQVASWECLKSGFAEALYQAGDMEPSKVAQQIQGLLSKPVETQYSYMPDMSAAAKLEQITDILCRTSLSLVHKRLQLRFEGKYTQFSDLPVDLQESIFRRALAGDEETLCACQRVCKSWRETCTLLTTWGFKGSFESLYHRPNSQGYPCSRFGYMGYHIVYHLSPSDLHVVVRTQGRRHTGSLSVRFYDEWGRPCSLRRWLSDPQFVESPTGVLVERRFACDPQGRSNIVVGYRGPRLVIELQISGRQHCGEVKLVLGKRLKYETSCTTCNSWQFWRRKTYRRESRIASIVSFGPG